MAWILINSELNEGIALQTASINNPVIDFKLKVTMGRSDHAHIFQLLDYSRCYMIPKSANWQTYRRCLGFNESSIGNRV